jgi:hypothetical protein
MSIPDLFLRAKFLKISAIAVICLLFAAGCKTENQNPPIEEIKFQKILIDIHLLQARMENYKSLNDTFFYATGKGYEEVYKKHHITQEQFKETFEYYLNNPKQMDKMYEKITEELSEQEAKAKE